MSKPKNRTSQDDVNPNEIAYLDQSIGDLSENSNKVDENNNSDLDQTAKFGIVFKVTKKRTANNDKTAETKIAFANKLVTDTIAARKIETRIANPELKEAILFEAK